MVLTLFTIIGCARCSKARRWLTDNKVPYNERCLDIDIHATTDIRNILHGRLPEPPALVSHYGLVATFDQLRLSIEQGTLMDVIIAESILGRPHSFIHPHDLLSPPRIKYDNVNDSTSSSTTTTPSRRSSRGDLVPSFESCDSTSHHLYIPDELICLLHDMKNDNIIRDNRVGLVRVYRNSFKGEHFIDWCISEKNMNRKEALEIGQDLLDRNIGQQTSKEPGDTFSPDRYYQLTEDDENKPLNSGEPPSSERISVREFNESLIRLIQPIYDHICESEGTHYYRLTENDNLLKYFVKSKELQLVNLSQATADERLALFLNIYNMLVIHITHKFGPPTSVWQRRKFVNTTYYTIDGHNYALQSILNGILRSNRRGRDMLWNPFGDQDLRLPLIMPTCDPLIHFAISTAARGDAPIRAYSVYDIKRQLREHVKEFIGRDEWVKIDSKKSVIYVSKIFKWYAEDFGSINTKILDWIINVMEAESDNDKRAELKRMYITGDYKIDYLHYDASFNGCEKLDRPTLPDLDCRIRTPSDGFDISFNVPPTPC